MTSRRFGAPRALTAAWVATAVLVTLVSPLAVEAARAATPYETLVLSDGPVAYYRLNETGGRTIVDVAGANDGVYGPTPPQFGEPGALEDGDPAVAFDDSRGAWGEIPRTIQDDFTIEFWVRTTSTRDFCGAWYCGAPLVDAEVCGGVGDFGVSVLGGKAAFGVGWADVTIASVRSINDGSYHHVVATREAVSGTMQLYVDGVLQASAQSPDTQSLTDAPYIGLGTNPCQRDGGGGELATLDEVALYTRVLPADRVAAHYDARPTAGTGAPAGRDRTLTVEKGGAGEGRVTSAPAGIDCGVDCSEDYADAARVTLTATPTGDSTFASWSSGCERMTANQCVVPMNLSQTITAFFSPARELSVSKAGTGSGEVTSAPEGIDCGEVCAHGFADGDTVTLEAVPGPGSTFLGWSGCDEVIADECSVTLSEDRAVTATFGVERISHERGVTLELTGHLVAAGRVSVPDGFEGCSAGILVKVQRRRPGTTGWVTAARTETDADGAYRARVKDLPRSYRVRVPARVLEGGEHSCRNAVSSVSVHGHGRDA